jgi:hypothetical protein
MKLLAVGISYVNQTSWYRDVVYDKEPVGTIEDVQIALSALSDEMDAEDIDEILVVQSDGGTPEVLHHWSQAQGDFGDEDEEEDYDEEDEEDEDEDD